MTEIETTETVVVPPQGRSRREVFRLGAAGAGALLLRHTVAPTRASASTVTTDDQDAVTTAAVGAPSDVQYDIGGFVPPAVQYNGIAFGLTGPSHTRFLTARLTRTPIRSDQNVLAAALAQIEGSYPWSPSGVFTLVSYGLPYFAKLPPALVAARLPRLKSDPSRSALEEAVPAPTDVVGGVDPLKGYRTTFGGARYSVRIEDNDILLSLRSDLLGNLNDVEAWLKGSGSLNGRPVSSPAFGGLFSWTSSRDMFVQVGLPAKLAAAAGLPYAAQILPDSPMWFNAADQNANGAGPAAITCFQGNASASLTTVTSRADYFYNGTIQHLSHNIDDLAAWYLPDYRTSLQYMFRATHPFGGGRTPFWPNDNYGTGDAALAAQGIGTAGNVRRLGHLACLQRSSRAADGTPMHARMDGPGFDGMDVGGTGESGPVTPKLQFSAFVPTADFFRRMRDNQASLDLTSKYSVSQNENGLERFITATRRQNFLMPPRRNRAFPLLELT